MDLRIGFKTVCHPAGRSGEDSLYVSSYSTAELLGGDGNDSLSTGEWTDYGVNNARLFGEEGDDNLHAYVDGYTSNYTDGDSSLNQSALLDGGEGDDTLYTRVRESYVSYGNSFVTSNGGSGDDQITVDGQYSYAGKASLSVSGGSGNDTIKISETTTGDVNQATSKYGFSSVSVDAGADDDTITVEGSLNTTITTGLVLTRWC